MGRMGLELASYVRVVELSNCLAVGLFVLFTLGSPHTIPNPALVRTSGAQCGTTGKRTVEYRRD